MNTLDLDTLVGQKLTEQLESQLLNEYPGIRIKKPGYMYTADFKMGRLNCNLDSKGNIQSFTRG